MLLLGLSYNTYYKTIFVINKQNKLYTCFIFKKGLPSWMFSFTFSEVLRSQKSFVAHVKSSRTTINHTFVILDDNVI